METIKRRTCKWCGCKYDKNYVTGYTELTISRYKLKAGATHLYERATESTRIHQICPRCAGIIEGILKGTNDEDDDGKEY